MDLHAGLTGITDQVTQCRLRLAHCYECHRTCCFIRTKYWFLLFGTEKNVTGRICEGMGDQ